MIVIGVQHEPTIVTIQGVHHLIRQHYPIGGAHTWCGLWTQAPERPPRAEHVCHSCVTLANDSHNGGPT